MAHFLAIVDRDQERRRAAADRAATQLVSLDGLVRGSQSVGSVTVLWAVGPRAPVSTAERGPAGCVVLGEPIPGPGPVRADADMVLERWAGGMEGGVPEPFSGFYAALVTASGGGALVGTDLLGLFPVYYWRTDGVVLVGTSPELFRHHPSFRMAISPEGLAGILMTNGLLGGQCLLEGVKRLRPGHLLRATEDGRTEECLQFELRRNDRLHDLSISALVDRLEEAMTAAVGRCAPPGEPMGLMLSGGLDSRMIAGFLHRAGIPVVAQTRGEPKDIELRCAKGVARTLGFEHLIAGDRDGDPVDGVVARVRWEHLANGLFSVGGSREVDPRLPVRAMSGYLVDVLIDSNVPVTTWPPPEEPFDHLFDHFFERLTRWGFPPETVGELMGNPAVPKACVESLRDEFRSAADSPVWARRSIVMRTAGRFRVGSMPWRQSFFSWPALPALDRDLIETINGMPMAAIGERLVEQELLLRKFPDLAALPLDHNAFDDTPLRPRLRYLATQFVLRRFGLSGEARAGQMPRGGERRYYYRTSDFNGAAWKAVRSAAEPMRGVLDAVLSRPVVDRLLPAPNADLVPEHRLTGATGAKLLIGLMFWSREHL